MLIIKDVRRDGANFVILRQVDDGPLLAHILPMDAMEWRAAEYDIDPGEAETLLRVVLYEPLLDQQSPDDPSHLFNAPTVAVARTYHLSRIAALAKAHAIRDSRAQLDLVRRGHFMNPEAVQAKREHVRRGRQARQVENARRFADPEAERVATLLRDLAARETPQPADPEAELSPDTNAVIRSHPGGRD